MIQFLLNDIQIDTALPAGMTILDFIRYEKNLSGTKIGCREGDCGACTILVGELKDDRLNYRSMTSCLMPLANAQGKHIVTIEGLNFETLNPVQQAMSDEGATQCGFCTPGFVVSLAGFCLQNKNNNVIAAIDGNICRCTGYKSIERAASVIADQLKDRGNIDPVKYAVDKQIIPAYFSNIKNKLQSINFAGSNGVDLLQKPTLYIGGGTDLYVQKHDEMVHSSADYLSDKSSLNGIAQEGSKCYIGASVTVTDLIESQIIRNIFPSFLKYTKLISSIQIRNMATIGGNFVNASPIGDFTVFFLALDARIRLINGSSNREIRLRDFYKGYKLLDKHPDEYIDLISFEIPSDNTHFNFEKVSKRTNLDIASVNSAIKITIGNNMIDAAEISAGGVGPIPMFLKKTSSFLIGKPLSEENIQEACVIAGDEITPISDVRGSASYKRLLLQQLLRAHFITLFPSINPEKLMAHAEY